MSENERKWYALVVKHQAERRTASALETLGVETLVPLYRSRRYWSDRVKELDLPLFAGYVLCRFAYEERIRISDAPGVSRIVGFGGRAAPIEDSEVAAIQAVLRSKLPVRPWPYLYPGDRVGIERGPLRGLEGTLLREKDNLQLVIGVELLRRSIAVELEPDMIVPARVLRAAG